MEDPTLNLCDGTRDCEHGCNRKTGVCVCNKGYVVFEGNKCSGDYGTIA